MRRFLSIPVLSGLLLLLVSGVFWPGLSGDFIFDDYPNIVTNQRVHATELDRATLQRAIHGYDPGTIGRPLATLTIAANWYAGGNAPWGYKLVNLGIHALNVLLVFTLLISIFRTPGIASSHTAVGAFVIALLWAVHPIQISTVLYVIQRMEILATTFILLALLAYLRGRKAQLAGARGWPLLAGSAVVALVGLGSKETAVLFPLFALALELTLLRFQSKDLRTRNFLKWFYGLGLAAALIVFAFWVLPTYTAPGMYDGREFTLVERLLSQLRVLPMYLGQMVLPVPSQLLFYYDAWPKSTGWLQPSTTLIGGLFLFSLLALAWRLRIRMPLFSLGVFWFFAAHVLTSNIFNLELAFEHRNYFALLGVLLAIADLVSRIPVRDGPAIKRAGVSVVVLTFGFLAILRAATWGAPLHLATDLVAKAPNSPRASSDLATLYVGMSDGNPSSPFFEFGRLEFERGSRLPNSSPLPEQGLILMAASTGLPVKDEWWSRLIHKVKTRPISPQEIVAVTGLMTQRYRGIELDDRRLSEAYSQLLRRGGMPAQMYVQYGDYALNYLDDRDLARTMYMEAVDHSRDDKQYPALIAGALVEDGHLDLAEAVLKRSAQVARSE